MGPSWEPALAGYQTPSPYERDWASTFELGRTRAALKLPSSRGLGMAPTQRQSPATLCNLHNERPGGLLSCTARLLRKCRGHETRMVGSGDVFNVTRADANSWIPQAGCPLPAPKRVTRLQRQLMPCGGVWGEERGGEGGGGAFSGPYCTPASCQVRCRCKAWPTVVQGLPDNPQPFQEPNPTDRWPCWIHRS